MNDPTDDPTRPKVHDFAPPTSPQNARTYGSTLEAPGGDQLRIDTQTESHSTIRSPVRGRSASQVSATAAHADGNSLLSPSRYSVGSLRRRPTRSNTVRHYHN